MGDLMTIPAPQLGRAPRGRAQHKTLIGSTGPAEAVKNLPSGLRTRACGLSSRAPVPKVIPEAIKVRIVELLKVGKVGSEIIAAVAAEFDGYSVSNGSVTGLAPRAGIVLVKGARRPTPRRELARQRRAQGLTESAIAAELGISKQRVSKLLSDDK